MKRCAIVPLAVIAAPPGFAHTQGESRVDYSKTEDTPFGRAADPKQAKRTIRIDMSDAMRFSPAQISVKRGEMVRLVSVNQGKLLHEMVLGTMADLEKHSELMRKFPGMEHDEPRMAHVAPGARGEIGWRFTRPGTYYYGCLIPGHFEAGMIGRIDVTP